MKRTRCAGLIGTVFSTLILSSGTAWAEPPVSGLVLGVERVFGFVANTATLETDNTTTTRSSAGFSLGSAGAAHGPSELGYAGSYSVPRVGVDYVLPSGLSFGGAFGVSTFGLEREADVGPGSVSTETDVTNLVFTPRVGYMLALGQQFAVWPRGGFSIIHSSIDRDLGGDSSATFGALTLEAPFAFFPRNFIGFVATPALDIGVSGSAEEMGQDVDGDLSLTEFGLTLGLFVVL